MTVLHSGFDGIDLAMKATLPVALVEFLEVGKAMAQELMADVWNEYAGLPIQCGQSGKRGGYAFTFRVDGFEAVWFAKKPKKNDPWGLFISIGSRQLALVGLVKTKATLEELCNSLGIGLTPAGVSLNRVDSAVDILAPGFILDPDHFVFHSGTGRRDIAELETIETNGRSGRVTPVTIGKMPGRQVILYDKREEVIKRRKAEWPLIWNAALASQRLPPLDLADRATSQVWRAEFRLGKAGLRRWNNIRNWSDFEQFLARDMNRLASDIRLAVPCADTNRSRWTTHPLWETAQDALSAKLFMHEVFVSPGVVRDIDLNRKREDVLKTIASLTVTHAYLDGQTTTTFQIYYVALAKRIQRMLARGPRGLHERFDQAARRHGPIISGASKR